VSKKAGIYMIRCLANGKVYIGQTSHISERWRRHRTELRDGIHGSRHLQAAWNKYGPEQFEFVVLELMELDKTTLTEREQHYIAQYHSNDKRRGFNRRIACDSNLGLQLGPFTAEHCAKIGAANRNRVYTAETRARMSAAQKQRATWFRPRHTEAFKTALSERNRRQPYTAAMREAASRRRGQPLSLETRAKLSAVLAGRKRPHDAVEKTAAAHRGKTRSPETRAKISLKAKGNKRCVGRVVSAQTRAKIGAKAKGNLNCVGRVLSAETRAKIAEAHRRLSQAQSRQETAQ
jgi:group I intron endonuclease